MGTLVNYATDKGVALLTLTDPPVNAYTHEMIKELDACILEARFDDDIHVIVVTGHGDKYFSAGANANMLKEADESFKYYFFLHASETLVRLENTPKLVVAAINGHCLGGGLEVALACDVRIARAGASQIGSPEVELGLMPGAGGTRRLVDAVGKSQALRLLVEGASLSVEEACEASLVHHAFEAETPEAFVRKVVAYAHGFCPPARAPLAVGAIKRAVQSSRGGTGLERELQQRLLESQDAREGVAAYIQKRKPTFHGR